MPFNHVQRGCPHDGIQEGALGTTDLEKVRAGRRLQLARQALTEARSVDFKAFLQAMEITDNRLSNWETGLSYPRHDKLARLNHLFGISADWVLCGQISKLPHDLSSAVLRRVKGTDDRKLISG